MQHYGVNGYSLHAMNSLSAMYNLHQQAAQQAQHAPDYRPSVHALTLAERLAGKNQLLILLFSVSLTLNAILDILFLNKYKQQLIISTVYEHKFHVYWYPGAWMPFDPSLN